MDILLELMLTTGAQDDLVMVPQMLEKMITCDFMLIVKKTSYNMVVMLESELLLQTKNSE